VIYKIEIREVSYIATEYYNLILSF